jgi:hypothetical protein
LAFRPLVFLAAFLAPAFFLAGRFAVRAMIVPFRSVAERNESRLRLYLYHEKCAATYRL